MNAKFPQLLVSYKIEPQNKCRALRYSVQLAFDVAFKILPSGTQMTILQTISNSFLTCISIFTRLDRIPYLV